MIRKMAAGKSLTEPEKSSVTQAAEKFLHGNRYKDYLLATA